MKIRKIPKIEIRQRKGSKGLMTGGNTEVLYNGKIIGSCTKAAFEVAANGVAKVTLELLGEVVVTGKIGKYTKVSTKLNTA